MHVEQLQDTNLTSLIDHILKWQAVKVNPLYISVFLVKRNLHIKIGHIHNYAVEPCN